MERISDRFDVGTDDPEVLAQIAGDNDSVYDCKTCGAKVGGFNLEKHHKWHQNKGD